MGAADGTATGITAAGTRVTGPADVIAAITVGRADDPPKRTRRRRPSSTSSSSSSSSSSTLPDVEANK